ncbi:hypothetical protein RCZ04_14670 [Capnocytophaga sp. HP1101]
MDIYIVMKNSIFFSALIGLFMGCKQHQSPILQANNTMATTAILPSMSTGVTSEVATKDTIITPFLSKKDSLVKSLRIQYNNDYDGYQRAIRKLVLQQKAENYLKNTCLEEFYLLGFASTTKDSIKVILPFNLHSFDCGAPDCYTTEVRFSLVKEKPIVFPEKLAFYEEQTGCTENYHFKNVYKLVEATHKHVIYHCKAWRRTLVLFFPKEKGSWSGDANYFVGASSKRFNGKNIYTVAQNYDENKTESEWNIAPYMIKSFKQREYEHMLKE